MTRGRAWLAGLALSALAACTSSGENYFGRLGAIAKASILGPEEQPPPKQLTRDELNEIPFATIAISYSGGPRAYLLPLADNGGYLTYLDSGGHGVVMLGGAVTGTQSLGQDLHGVRYDRRDPVAHPTPVAEWPAQVYRDYQFRERDGADYSITLSCVFEPLARESIDIVEIDFDVVRVSEVCTNARRQVTNTYWVEEETGFIWKSEQWLGPWLQPMTVEIIRPYSG